MSGALFTAGKDRGVRAHSSSPLVQDGQKLMPSVTRVFSRSRAMYAFLEAYQQEVGPARPLLAFVTFFRDGRKAFESAPLLADEAASNRLKTMALSFTLRLETLDEGEYTCQVTVLDAGGKKEAFWQAPVMIVR